jgi:hypothetical protein
VAAFLVNWRKRSARIAPMSQAVPLPIAMPKTSFGAALTHLQHYALTHMY